MYLKKLTAIILAIIMCLSFASCSKAETEPKESNEDQTIQVIMMSNDILLSFEKLLNANEICIQANYALLERNIKEAKIKNIKSMDEIKAAEQYALNCISSPSYIQEEFALLKDQMKSIIEILGKEDSISDEEFTDLVSIVKSSAEIHIRLMDFLQCFANLYSIREYDALSDEEAKKQLKDKWVEFGFEDDVECPDSIETQELYIIWAKQFSEDFVETDEFKEQLDELRKNDKLDSADYNQKWEDLIRKFIIKSSTE